MTISAALLNQQGIFLKIDTVKNKAELTDLHLPQITACDLPPGQYRWVADQKNPYGGAFWPLPELKQPAER